jgi:6-phosphogluconolactonase
MKVHGFGSSLALAMFILLQGCGGGSSSGGNSNGVVPPPPVLTGPEFLYVGTANFPAGSPTELLVFPINFTTGALGAPTTIPAANPVTATAGDPFGKVLYTADGTTGAIHEYSVNGSTGALTEFSGSPFPPLPNPAVASTSNLYTDTQNRFVYLSNCGFARNAAGALTPITNPCFAQVQGVSFAVDPGNKFVIAACQLRNAPTCVNAINPVNGSLEGVPGGPATVSSFTPHAVAAHPSGKFVYTGGLFDPSPPFPAPPDPHERIVVYSLDRATGILSVTAQTEFQTRLEVIALTLDPAGKFLYAADSQNVFGFSVNAANGTLTPVPGSLFPGHPFQDFSSVLRVDPAGKFLYLAATDIGAVVGYKIDPGTGSLTPIPGSPFLLGATPVTLSAVRTP